MSDDISPIEIRRLEARWKSDVDLKLDKMIAFIAKNESFLDMLIEREKGRAAIRRAIVDKSITALIWGAIAGLGVLVVSGFKTEATTFIDGVKNLRK